MRLIPYNALNTLIYINKINYLITFNIVYAILNITKYFIELGC